MATGGGARGGNTYVIPSIIKNFKKERKKGKEAQGWDGLTRRGCGGIHRETALQEEGRQLPVTIMTITDTDFLRLLTTYQPHAGLWDF